MTEEPAQTRCDKCNEWTEGVHWNERYGWICPKCNDAAHGESGAKEGK